MPLRRFAARFSKQRIPTAFVKETSFALFSILTWFPALIFFNDHVGELQLINGPSMYPFLNTDYDRSLRRDVCWTQKWAAAEDLKRGMIVTFWSPSNPEVQAVKRVIALEGDRVLTRAPYPHPIAEIPPGHVWVEGDGGHLGKQSLDSNTYGPISRSLIVGRLTYVVWPWNSFGPIRWWEWKEKTKVFRREAHVVLK